MSAFLVGKEHINAMITAGLANHPHYGELSWYHEDERYVLNELTADSVGQMLLDENVNSVMYRYDEDTLTDLPGKTNAEWLIPFIYKPDYEGPNGLQALSIIMCYEYQSCEHPEWESSQAKVFCDALAKRQYRRLPGWDDAPWEWTKPANPNVRRLV